MRKCLDPLCAAPVIRAVECLDFIEPSDLRPSAACRAVLRDRHISAFRQILRDLWNDHIRFINRNAITDSKLQ